MLFLLFLIIGLYCLIPAVIVHIVMPIGIQIKEIKVEIETDRVTTEAKLSTCSIYFEVVQIFVRFLFIRLFDLFFKWNKFLFYLYFLI